MIFIRLMGKRFALMLKKRKEKNAAQHQIQLYFDEATKIFSKDKRKANDNVRKARTLAMKYKIRLPRELKRKFCKQCYCFLMPGVNCRIRTRPKRVIYYCLECKKYMRFPYNKNRIIPHPKG